MNLNITGKQTAPCTTILLYENIRNEIVTLYIFYEAFIIILYTTSTHVVTSKSRLKLYPVSSNQYNYEAGTFLKWTYNNQLFSCYIIPQVLSHKRKHCFKLLTHEVLIININSLILAFKTYFACICHSLICTHNLQW